MEFAVEAQPTALESWLLLDRGKWFDKQELRIQFNNAINRDKDLHAVPSMARRV